MKAILFFLFSFGCVSASAQTWEWARKADATAAIETPTEVMSDGLGNTYLFGTGSGGSQYGSTVLSPGKFLVKLNSSGNVIWAKNIPFSISSTSVFISDYYLDEYGNSYFLGQFYGTFTVESFTFTSNGVADVFVVKLDPAGNPLWGKSFGGTGSETPGRIIADGEENVYFDGGFQDSVSFGPSTIFDTTSTFFLTKLDAAGNVAWATAGHNDFEFGGQLILDDNANIYVVGSASSFFYYFIAKFDNNGNLLFHQNKWGSYDFVPTLKFSQAGNIFLLHNGGGHYGYVPILAKYDTLMNLQWSRGIGTYYGCYQFDAGVFLDEFENVYVGGTIGNQYCYSDSVYFQGTLAYIGEHGVPAIAKFDTWGNHIWTKTALSSDYDVTNAMDIDKDGNLIIAGIFNASGPDDTLRFDSHILYNDGNYSQIFIAKLNPNGVPTGHTEIVSSELINIFPNPSSGIFTLRMNNSNAKVCVRDVMGRCILKQGCKNEINEIDLSANSKGVYFIEVLAEGKSVVKKIVIQ